MKRLVIAVALSLLLHAVAGYFMARGSFLQGTPMHPAEKR